MRFPSGRLRALFAERAEESLRGHVSRAAAPPPRTPPAWPVGTLLGELDAEGSVCATRMVVGYAPDGACLTTYVTASPWLTQAEAARIYRGSQGLCALPPPP